MNKIHSKTIESARSLQSGNTNSSKFTRDSVKTDRKFNGAVFMITGSDANGQRVIGLLHTGNGTNIVDEIREEILRNIF
jgi:hypothetical protein